MQQLKQCDLLQGRIFSTLVSVNRSDSKKEQKKRRKYMCHHRLFLLVMLHEILTSSQRVQYRINEVYTFSWRNESFRASQNETKRKKTALQEVQCNLTSHWAVTMSCKPISNLELLSINNQNLSGQNCEWVCYKIFNCVMND